MPLSRTLTTSRAEKRGALRDFLRKRLTGTMKPFQTAHALCHETSPQGWLSTFAVYGLPLCVKYSTADPGSSDRRTRHPISRQAALKMVPDLPLIPGALFWIDTCTQGISVSNSKGATSCASCLVSGHWKVISQLSEYNNHAICSIAFFWLLLGTYCKWNHRSLLVQAIHRGHY